MRPQNFFQKSMQHLDSGIHGLQIQTFNAFWPSLEHLGTGAGLQGSVAGHAGYAGSARFEGQFLRFWALSGQSPRPRGDACRLRPGPAPGHKGTLQWPPGASIHSCSDSGGAGRQTRQRLIAKSCLLISATFAASAGVSIGLTVRPTGHRDKAWRIKGTGRFHNGFQTL